MKYKRQQVILGLQDSSQYSGRSPQRPSISNPSSPIIIIIIIIIIPGNFPHQSSQVTSGFQGSSNYSRWSKKCYCLNGLDSLLLSLLLLVVVVLLLLIIVIIIIIIFDHTDKWYMHNPESVLENEKQKFFWNLRYKQIT